MRNLKIICTDMATKRQNTIEAGKPSAAAIIADLKTRPFEIPSWDKLKKEYYPCHHPVMDKTAYPDKVSKKTGRPIPVTRVTRALQRRATKTMAGLLFGIPVKRIYTYNKKDETEKKAAALSADGKTPIYMAADGKLTALFAVADAIKPDAVEAIRLLKEMNVKLVMLTGDNSLTAKAVAAKVGIDEVRSEVLPGDKAGEVARLQNMGYTVAMVGDGVNDAPALVKADTGIAIGAGADVAIESADIVLMGGELGGVAAALRLSRAAMTNIKENLFWAFGYNTLGIPVAAGVLYAFGGPLLSPMIAAAAMSLSSVSVVTNALRLRRFDPNKTHKYLKPHSSKKNGGNDAAQAGNNNNITSKEETNMITLKVNGMMCQHCQKAVEKALAEIGATDITVDLANKQATFANADEAAARKAITDAGYEVE